MDDPHSTTDGIHDQEEAEEALSLCDFPITTAGDDQTNCNGGLSTRHNLIRSSSEPSDFFEFFNVALTSEMSHAEDIIFCGKLIPFKPQQQIVPLLSQSQKTSIRDQKQKGFQRRRSESLSELKSAQLSGSDKTQLVRSSRSLDYQKLARNLSVNSDETCEIRRNSSLRTKALKPRWYVLMFGSMRFPPEMELRDIKNRQVRRTAPATLFPPPLDGGGGKIQVNRSHHRKSSWGLFRVLSCKENASVAVTASFGNCMPKV